MGRRSRDGWSDAFDTLDNITIGKNDSTIGENMTSNVFRLHFGSKSTQFSEYVCKFRILLSSTIVDLVRNTVKISRDFILLFTLSLSELLGSTKGSAEAIILIVSWNLRRGTRS
jgi:hypothetical protein